MPTTALIILNYNNWQDTLNCLESVKRFNTAPIKVFVIDNGSESRDSVDKISAYLASSRLDGRLVVNPENLGYARGNNVGIDIACADDSVDYIMILNNDILFTEDLIPTLIDNYAKLDSPALVSPLLFGKNGDIDRNCARRAHTNMEVIMGNLQCRTLTDKLAARNRRFILDDYPKVPSAPFEIELPSGSCMLIDKNTMKDLGGFDPGTFLYFEENILHKKILKLGLKNYLIPTVSCIHLGAQSTGRMRSAKLVKIGLDSTQYYLNKFGNMTLAERLANVFTSAFLKVKIALLKIK